MRKIMSVSILLIALLAGATNAATATIEYPTGATVVAAFKNAADEYFDTTAEAFEAWNVLTDYDVAAADSGNGDYQITVPATLPAGVYTIKWYSSGSHFASIKNWYWSGTAVYDPAADAKTAAEANKALLEHATYGLAALKALIDTIDTVVDSILAISPEWSR